MDAQPRARISGTAGPHLLLVEDDPVVLAAVRRRLAFDGYRVDTARCSSEALHWLAGNSPDLVILGVTGSSGEEAEMEMRIRLGCTAPVLVLTAFRTVVEKADPVPAGESDWLVKPFAIDDLLLRIRTLLLRVGIPRNACPVANARAREGG